MAQDVSDVFLTTQRGGEPNDHPSQHLGCVCLFGIRSKPPSVATKDEFPAIHLECDPVRIEQGEVESPFASRMEPHLPVEMRPTALPPKGVPLFGQLTQNAGSSAGFEGRSSTFKLMKGPNFPVRLQPTILMRVFPPSVEYHPRWLGALGFAVFLFSLRMACHPMVGSFISLPPMLVRVRAVW